MTIGRIENGLHVGGRRRSVKNRATHPHLFLKLSDYGALPTFSGKVVDYWTAAADAALSMILANNRLGDCAAAAPCHIVDAVTSAAGSPVVLTEDQAVAFYSLESGYVPGDPSTDRGSDLVTVLQTWQAKGLDGNGAHKIVGWVSLDPTSPQQIMSWLAAFGPTILIGLELSEGMYANIANGTTWTLEMGPPDPSMGHCIAGLGGIDLVGDVQRGLTVNSWGREFHWKWDALPTFLGDGTGGEIYGVLTQEILEQGKAATPDAIDWASLEADFAAMER